MIEIAVNNLAASTGDRTVTEEVDWYAAGALSTGVRSRRGTILTIPGEKVDGNDFASRAIESGSGAVVMTRQPDAELVSLAQDKGCAILMTDDPEEFLLRLAHVYRLELGCLVVGITGSIGKTTTKDVLAAVLAKRYRVWATKGNFNNLIGMPLTVLSAPADTEVLVLEMGMNHFHEIERLSQSANPNLAIVSKIGTSHIGILGSRENIARAKSEIVQGMCAAGDFSPLLVLGGEDDFTPFIRDTFAQPAGIDVMMAGGLGRRRDPRARHSRRRRGPSGLYARLWSGRHGRYHAGHSRRAVRAQCRQGRRGRLSSGRDARADRCCL